MVRRQIVQRKNKRTVICVCMIFILSILISLPGPSQAFLGKINKAPSKKEAEQVKITEQQLRSFLIDYADRASTILGQIAMTFKGDMLSPEFRLHIMSDLTYTLSAVYVLAAEPNPLSALLDMTVILAAGSTIYEVRHLPKYGEPIAPVAKGYQVLEQEIWQIVDKVLSKEQQKEFRDTITERYKDYPDLVNFTSLRFKDFAELRATSFSKEAEAGGLLAPVSKATQQIEETRQLAERALFLATRIPLMGGAFMNVWLSLWMTNPDVNRTVESLNVISSSMMRLLPLVETMPKQIEQTSAKILDNTMDRLAVERQNIIRDFASEEQRLRGLVLEAQKTVTGSQNLVNSIDGLAARLGFSPDKPVNFDIEAYRNTATELKELTQGLTTTMTLLDKVVSYPEIKQILPNLNDAIVFIGNESKGFVNHIFWMLFLVAALSIICFFVVRFIYQYALKRYALKA